MEEILKSVPVCPNCKSNNKISYIIVNNKKYSCENKCNNIFECYSKKGYKCPNCNGFIPESHLKEKCIYNNCNHDLSKCSLDFMRHPFKTIDFIDKNTEFVKITSFNNKKNKINFIIDKILFLIDYRSIDSKVKIKQVLLETIRQLSFESEEFVNFIYYNKKNDIFCKFFQRFICNFEKELPVSFFIFNKFKTLSSIEDFGFFDGKTEFISTINTSFEAVNNTKDIWYDSRKKGMFTKMFIGKIISASCNGIDITNKIISYDFNKIVFTKDIVPGTEVTITHLMLRPVYNSSIFIIFNSIMKEIRAKLYEKI